MPNLMVNGDALSLRLAQPARIQQSGSTEKAKGASEESFGSVMNQVLTADTARNQAQANTQNDSAVKTLQNTGQKKQASADQTSKVQKNPQKDQTKTDTKANDTIQQKDQTQEADNITGTTKTATGKTQGTKDDSQMSDLETDITKAADKMVTEVAEELDVTEEEVLSAMEILGLTAADLLNPQDLTQVVTQIGGEAGTASLLTDSDLYEGLQNLIQTATDLKVEIMDNYDLYPDEFDSVMQALDQIQQADAFDRAPEQEDNLMTFTQAEAQVQNEVQAGDQKVRVEITDERTSGSDDELPENALKEISARSEAEAETADKASEHQTSDSSEHDGGQAGSDTGASPYQQIMTGIQNAVDNITSTVERQMMSSASSTTSTQDIMNQITEYMKVNIKPESTSMEMQLHPASLGTIRVMIQQAEDGGVTARFTAQNASVANALQTQLMQLQQKLDESGIKVNAVEVAVDAHAFEQNLEQGNGQNASEQEQKRQTSRIRRLNLGDLDLSQEDATELDDETRIATEMMAANGNQIDFTA